MLFTVLILKAFMKRHCWVVDGSWLHKAKCLWYLGLWGQPEGNHMAAIQSYTKATGGPWGRDRIFIFSKRATWSVLKENKLHVGNDANKKYAWSIKWNHEALMLEWTPTLELGVQGWNFKEDDNSGILEKNILCFFLLTITSAGIALLTQAEEPVVLATTVMLLVHLRE